MVFVVVRPSLFPSRKASRTEVSWLRFGRLLPKEVWSFPHLVEVIAQLPMQLLILLERRMEPEVPDTLKGVIAKKNKPIRKSLKRERF